MLGRLSDRIIGNGPFVAGMVNELHFATAAEMNELRDELIAARGAAIGRGAVPSHSTGVVEGAWDGPANEKRLPSPVPTGTARRVYAWVDQSQTEDGKVAKAACKMPHHNVSGDGTPGPANLNGVRNALARLPQSNIPEADRAAVERHLRRHLDAQSDDDDGRSAAQLADQALAGIITVDEWRARLSTSGATTGATTVTVRADGGEDPPEDGVREPADTPVPPTPDSAARSAVDPDAARDLLAALTF